MRLRIPLSALVAAALCLPGWGAPVELSRPIPELRLTNGAVLHEVTIVATGSTTVLATWAGGKGTILLSLLPDELRAALNRQHPAKGPARTASEGLTASDLELGANGLPFRIKLKNGFVMRDCEILHWSEDSIIVRFVGGTVPVQFANIDGTQRASFEAKRTDALQKQSEAAKAANLSRESQRYQTQLDAEIHDKQERAKEIKQGLLTHNLAIGMTMEDVRSIYGTPTSTSETIEDIKTVHTEWTYAKRKDSYLPNGTLQDTKLQFFDGFLKSWDPNMNITVELTEPQG